MHHPQDVVQFLDMCFDGNDGQEVGFCDEGLTYCVLLPVTPLPLLDCSLCPYLIAVYTALSPGGHQTFDPWVNPGKALGQCLWGPALWCHV
jgi:hypothetical protein